MLSDRKKEVLYYIIQAYIESSQPVSSKSLTSKFKNSISAATIRNEMSELEELGYITHPHTSAGRVPTDRGYRYYVDYLLQRSALSDSSVHIIKNEYGVKLENLDNLINKTARIVSTLSHEACVAAVFSDTFLTFKQVNLVFLEPQRVVVIWTTSSGIVKNSIIDMPEGISADLLKQIENFLNKELEGLPLDEVEAFVMKKLSQERNDVFKIYKWAQYVITNTLMPNSQVYKISLDGRQYLLEKPEFKDFNKTCRLFNLLEDSDDLVSIIGDSSLSTSLTVRIGKENHYDDMWDCSVVSTNYYVRNVKAGSISVVGPRRLQYERIIPLLGHISQIITETLNKIEVIEY